MRLFFFLVFTAGFSLAFRPADCGETPDLNKQVIAFVQTKIKKKVGSGECWDLAAAALNSLNADWDGMYEFGTPVDAKKDCIFPGDIIQFEGVVVKYEKDGMKLQENMSHHTAIIYEVKSTGVYTLAHQNIGTSGRKVGLTSLDLSHIVKGKYQVYRPVK